MPSTLRTQNYKQKTINTFQVSSFKFQVKRGFTLIELLVGITIIALLVGIGSVSYSAAQRKNRDSRRKNDLRVIQQALEGYYDKNGEYPQTTTTSTSWGALNTALVDGGYISNLPIDPINKVFFNPGNNNDYAYVYYACSPYPPCTPSTPYQSYSLFANLENNSDPDINISGMNVGFVVWVDYKVENP